MKKDSDEAIFVLPSPLDDTILELLCKVVLMWVSRFEREIIFSETISAKKLWQIFKRLLLLFSNRPRKIFK